MNAPPPTQAESTMPVGPWLLVVGMHRSGTSAITGALGHLGLATPIPKDRYSYYAPTEDNPEHWESRAMGDLDDALLERLGGTWDGPPDAGWESDPDVDLDAVGDPGLAASTAYPQAGPVVWKDPRSCLLLPYWLAHLPKPVAAVFIWRWPLSVAGSLQARDGMHLADGVALWERYNRAGLAGLVGVDTFVMRYESIVEDPLDKLGALASWLGERPDFAPYAPHWDLASAATSILPELRRQQATGDSELLFDEQRRLVEHLESLHGPHGPLASLPPGEESPWTTAVLSDRKQRAAVERQRDALERQRDALQLTLAERETAAEALAEEVARKLDLARAQLEGTKDELAAMYALYERTVASTSWRVTRPIRQVAGLKDRKGGTPGV